MWSRKFKLRIWLFDTLIIIRAIFTWEQLSHRAVKKLTIVWTKASIHYIIFSSLFFVAKPRSLRRILYTYYILSWYGPDFYLAAYPAFFAGTGYPAFMPDAGYLASRLQECFCCCRLFILFVYSIWIFSNYRIPLFKAPVLMTQTSLSF